MGNSVKSKETLASLAVVGKMFEAFGKGDMETLKTTVSEDSVWNYEGPKEIRYRYIR